MTWLLSTNCTPSLSLGRLAIKIDFWNLLHHLLKTEKENTDIEGRFQSHFKACSFQLIQCINYSMWLVWHQAHQKSMTEPRANMAATMCLWRNDTHFPPPPPAKHWDACILCAALVAGGAAGQYPLISVTKASMSIIPDNTPVLYGLGVSPWFSRI
jgi:hypothetical protein